MATLESPELDEFREMVNKLIEKSSNLTGGEMGELEEVQKCIVQAEALYLREKKVQALISALAIFLLVIAMVSVLVTWAADFSVPVSAVGGAGVISLFGLGIKAKADNDLSRAKAELEKTIFRLDYGSRG